MAINIQVRTERKRDAARKSREKTNQRILFLESKIYDVFGEKSPGWYAQKPRLIRWTENNPHDTKQANDRARNRAAAARSRQRKRDYINYMENRLLHSLERPENQSTPENIPLIDTRTISVFDRFGAYIVSF